MEKTVNFSNYVIQRRENVEPLVATTVFRIYSSTYFILRLFH